MFDEKLSQAGWRTPSTHWLSARSRPPVPRAMDLINCCEQVSSRPLVLLSVAQDRSPASSLAGDGGVRLSDGPAVADNLLGQPRRYAASIALESEARSAIPQLTLGLGSAPQARRSAPHACASCWQARSGVRVGRQGARSAASGIGTPLGGRAGASRARACASRGGSESE